MKKFLSLSVLLGVVTLSTARADTIALWTFESSLPTGSPGAGVWLTNIAAEVGSGVASGFHTDAASYSNPSGNGSAESFSVNTWTTVGDLFQFAVSTVGYENVGLSWDQTSSGTGPKLFNLEYSTDGSSFSTFVANYIARTNAAATDNSGSGVDTSGFWSSGSSQTGYSYSYDLSSETSLNDASTVYFRLVLSDLTNAQGNTTPSSGTDRVDNFMVTASVVPEPSVLALLAVGGSVLLSLRRRK